MSQTFDLQNIVAENIREIGEGAMRELKAANEALTKRVAELEHKAYDLEMQLGPWSMEYVDGLKKQIAALESQLAWKPVAQWPSEPGCYEFTDGTCDDTACYELADNRWFGKSMHDKRSPMDLYPYTMFRRITLPEAT